MKSWLDRVRQLDQQMPGRLGLLALQYFGMKNARLIAYLFVIGILAYGAHLVEFFLAIDAEYHSQRFGAKLQWVSQGRWGMYVLNSLLLPDPVMLFVPTLLAIVGLVSGTLLVLHAWSDVRGMADYLAAPIAIACPVIYFSLYFTTLGYGIGIGYGFVGLGLFALSRWSWRWMPVAVLAWAFAIGIYQAMAPLIAVLFALYVTIRIVSRDDGDGLLAWLKKGAIFSVVLGLSLLLYAVISNLAMRAQDLHFDSAYLSGFVRFTPSWEYWTATWENTYRDALAYYTGSARFYLYDLWSLKALFYFSLLFSVVLVVFAWHRSVFVRMLGLLALLLAFLASISMYLMNSGYMPPRAMLAVPWVLAGLVFIVARRAGNAVKAVLLLLVASCFYNFVVTNNRYHFSSYMQWQADKTFSMLLLDRLYSDRIWGQLPPKGFHEQYPVALVGLRKNVESPIFIHREVVGASFYKWDAGNVHRMASLFFSMGILDYRGAGPEETMAVAEYSMSMPSWPHEDSVQVVDGIIVVKLSDYHPHQISRMCTGWESHDFCRQQQSR